MEELKKKQNALFISKRMKDEIRAKFEAQVQT